MICTLAPKKRPLKDAPKIARKAHVSSRNGRKLAIGIDPSGRVHYGKDNIGGDHVVAVLGEEVSDAYLAELREDGVSYVFAGPKGDDLPRAMEEIASLLGVLCSTLFAISLLIALKII